MQTAQLFFPLNWVHINCTTAAVRIHLYLLLITLWSHNVFCIFLYQVLCHVANLLLLVKMHCVLPHCSSRSCQQQQSSAEPSGLHPHTASGGWDVWLVLVPQCLLHPPCCLHPLHLMQLREAFCCCVSIWTVNWYLNPLLICQNCISMSSRSVYPKWLMDF